MKLKILVSFGLEGVFGNVESRENINVYIVVVFLFFGIFYFDLEF